MAFVRFGFFTCPLLTEKKIAHRTDREIRKMGSDARSSANGGGFKSKMEHFMYSGDKKHVVAGIFVISVAFGIPWFLMNRGTKHQSHQDYMDKADKARSERLSSSSASAR